MPRVIFAEVSSSNSRSTCSSRRRRRNHHRRQPLVKTATAIATAADVTPAIASDITRLTSTSTTPIKGEAGQQLDLDFHVDVKKDKKKGLSLSVFDFSDEESETENQFKQQLHLHEKEEEGRIKRRDKGEEKVNHRNVDNIDGDGDDADAKESETENRITYGTNAKNSERERNDHCRDHDVSSVSSSCEIQKIKCSIDYHQRQVLHYQKKLDQLLTSIGKINNNDNHNSGDCNKNCNTDKISKNTSTTSAIGKADKDSGSSNANAGYKYFGSERKINKNDNVENRGNNCPDKILHHGSIDDRSESESESTPLAASTKPSSLLSSSKSLVSTQKQSLAFDIHEIPAIEPFRNQRTVYNFYQKRGLKMPSSSSSSQAMSQPHPQPQPQPQSKEANLKRNSMSKDSIPLQQQQRHRQQQHLQCSSMESSCTRTNTAVTACTPPHKQFHDGKMVSEKQQGEKITKNSTTSETNTGLNRKLSEPIEEITNRGIDSSCDNKTTIATNGANTRRKTLNIDTDRTSPFTTIIKKYYANKKRKFSEPKDTTNNTTTVTATSIHCGNSQVGLERGESNSKNNTKSFNNRKYQSHFGSSPPSSSSSYHTCFSTGRTPSRGGSCSSSSTSSKAINTQEHHRWSSPAPSSPFLPVSHDQRSVDATKRFWEEQVLYLQRHQQRQQQEETALCSYNNYVNNDNDVFEDCHGTLGLGLTPEKYQQKRQCNGGSNRKSMNSRSLYEVRLSPVNDASTSSSSTRQSIENDSVGNKTSRNNFGDKNNMGFSSRENIHSSLATTPTTAQNIESPKQGNAFIYILSSDSDEGSDYGM